MHHSKLSREMILADFDTLGEALLPVVEEIPVTCDLLLGDFELDVSGNLGLQREEHVKSRGGGKQCARGTRLTLSFWPSSDLRITGGEGDFGRTWTMN